MTEVQPLRKIAAWKKCRCLNSEIQALVDAGLLQDKVLINWNCAGGDPYPMEKNPSEIPMFAVFPERGLALSTSDFFWGMLDFYKIEHVHLNPNGMFHTSVFVHFCEAFLGIRPH